MTLLTMVAGKIECKSSLLENGTETLHLLKMFLFESEPHAFLKNIPNFFEKVIQEKSCVWKKLKKESNCNILQKGHIPFHVESIVKGWTSEGWHTICGVFTGILKCLVSWILQWNNQSNNSSWSSLFYLLHGMQNCATMKWLRNGQQYFPFFLD